MKNHPLHKHIPKQKESSKYNLRHLSLVIEKVNTSRFMSSFINLLNLFQAQRPIVVFLFSAYDFL